MEVYDWLLVFVYEREKMNELDYFYVEFDWIMM